MATFERVDSNKAIGERLELLREAFGYNKTMFAAFCQISPQSLGNYLSGLNRPNLEQANLIRSRTGATLDWIYHGEEAGLPKQLSERLFEARQKQTA